MPLIDKEELRKYNRDWYKAHQEERKEKMRANYQIAKKRPGFKEANAARQAAWRARKKLETITCPTCGKKL
jgi:hypothetical protein